MGLPQAIGRFTVIRPAGAGTYAGVWLAHDQDLDVDVAVKVLAERWAADPEARHRFLEEAHELRVLPNDRIVEVHEAGTLQDGRPYMVMDFCDRGTLED